MIDSDLKRSYYQYQQHIKLGLLKLTFMHKLFLSCAFVGIFLCSLVLSMLWYKKNNKKGTNCLVINNNREPYITIKREFLKVVGIESAEVSRFILPVLPMKFYAEIFRNYKFYIRRMDFLGALSIKLMQYFSLYHKKNMKVMIVLQEYSFYMSYLTFLIENSHGKLFNIMHGIPGDEASYFRFSKCFVWGEFYKKFYIEHFAEKTQFLVSGSVYHTSLIERADKSVPKEYDIVYLMQGNGFATQDEIDDVLEILEGLSVAYKVVIKQHPLHNVTIKYNLEEIVEKDIFSVLNNCKIALSHFSTSLLDAKLLGINVVSYSKINRKNMLEFLDQEEIATSKEDLLSSLKNSLQNPSRSKPLEHIYIDTDVNTLSVIKKEIGLI